MILSKGDIGMKRKGKGLGEMETMWSKHGLNYVPTPEEFALSLLEFVPLKDLKDSDSFQFLPLEKKLEVIVDKMIDEIKREVDEREAIKEVEKFSKDYENSTGCIIDLNLNKVSFWPLDGNDEVSYPISSDAASKLFLKYGDEIEFSKDHAGIMIFRRKTVEEIEKIKETLS